MKRDLRLYLDDILEAIKKIEDYRVSLTFRDFSKDDKTVDAVVRNFEIIEKRRNAFLQTLGGSTLRFRGGRWLGRGIN